MLERMQRLFYFNDTATTEIYTLSLHDALPISRSRSRVARSELSYPRTTLSKSTLTKTPSPTRPRRTDFSWRSEEHTSELQSHVNLVCRLLLEKKKITNITHCL